MELDVRFEIFCVRNLLGVMTIKGNPAHNNHDAYVRLITNPKSEYTW